jgi:hypothetical protein
VAASIAQREDSEARKEFDSKLYSEVNNLLKEKDQQMKLMEITGGLKNPNFNEYLATLKTLDCDIKNAKNQIEQLKSQKRSSNPIVSSLLASLLHTVEPKPTKRRKSAGGDSTLAPSAEVEILRRSPAAMSTLTNESVQEQQMQSNDSEDNNDHPHDEENNFQV